MAEWISYESADGPPEEVSVDIDFDDDNEFRAGHPVLVTVTVSGFADAGGGQPDDETADALYEVEEAVDATLEEHGNSLVCSASGNDRFVLYGYANDVESTQALQSIEHELLKIEVRTENDAAWATYGRYVLRGEELEDARDAEQMDQLEEEGVDFADPIEVSFYLEFDTPQQMQAALGALDNAGYNVPEVEAYETTDEGLVISRSMMLSTDALRDERHQLQTIIAPFGGRYGGWAVDEDAIEEPLLSS